MMPGGLTRLEKLREVYLSKNELWSDLPPDIGLMEDLEDIRVNENEMFGRIPESLYDLTKLKKLWLQDTLHCEQSEVTGWTCDVTSDYGFEGPISTGIGNLKKLSQLLLNNNPLTGELPTEIGQCEELGKCYGSLCCWDILLLSSFCVRTKISHPLLNPSYFLSF